MKDRCKVIAGNISQYYNTYDLYTNFVMTQAFINYLPYHVHQLIDVTDFEACLSFYNKRIA